MTTKKTETLVAYKGFDPQWKCRDFQYELGKTYTHEGDAKLCSSGFHACEYPLDIFSYYEPTGQMAQVELSDVSEEKEDGGDSKRCGKSITIKASLTIPLLVAASIEYTLKRSDPVKAQHSEGDQKASSATGDSSASSATGDRSASSATGYRSASSATGDSSASSATGYRSASSATGDSSASSATGYKSASSATGDSSASSATGDRSASSATGDRSASSATGYRSASSATGYRSASITTGAFSSSEVLKADSQSVAIGVGYQSKAKAASGCAIVLAHRDDKGKLVHIRAAIVGDAGVKADTWYTLNESGEFVETA